MSETKQRLIVKFPELAKKVWTWFIGLFKKKKQFWSWN
jgi:hypothetical protein